MGGNGASCLCYDSTLLNGAWAHEPVTYIICYVLSRNLHIFKFCCLPHHSLPVVFFLCVAYIICDVYRVCSMCCVCVVWYCVVFTILTSKSST
jgi:hypothetical protein